MAERRRRGRPARRGVSTERGTALLLFPSALIVVFLLAAIAIDSAAMFHAQRQAYRAAAQASDDAASMIDLDRVYTDGTVVLDHDRATATALASLHAARLPGSIVGAPAIVVDPVGGTVTVEVTLEVEHLFFAAVPATGAPKRLTVVAAGRLDHQP